MLPPKSFSTEPFIKAAEILLCADEVKRALELLDNLPAYYRIIGNEPKEITELRNKIMKRVATPSFYANHAGDELTMGDNPEKMVHTLRGALLAEDIKNCNNNTTKPLLVDLGPGEFWAPRMLESLGCEFWYQPIYVNNPSYEFYKPKFQHRLLPQELLNNFSQPKIFFAGEILEHLWQPMDIRFEMQKFGSCDIAHVTTPNGSFNPSVMNWLDIGWLGHLHAFTFEEFKHITAKAFKEYQGAFYDSQIFHARFILPSGRFEFLKTHYQLQTAAGSANLSYE